MFQHFLVVILHENWPLKTARWICTKSICLSPNQSSNNEGRGPGTKNTYSKFAIDFPFPP